jgi:iron complex transport system permease protein
VVALVASLLVAVSVGSVAVPVGDVWQVVAYHVLGAFGSSGPAPDQSLDAIVWTFRVPRALLAAVVGAGLAVAGTALQALVRNPLADPYVLGVVNGSSFGAVLALTLGTAALGKTAISAGAFAGGLVSMLVVLVFGRRAGRVSPTRLVLAGVAVGYVFSAATSYLELRMSDGNSLAGVIFWLLGTVAAAAWSDLGLPAAVVLVSAGWLMLQARPLNALLAGDDAAVTLGVNVSRFRIQLVVISSMLTGAVVAVAGGVGFVGLMVPHVARLLVGADHRRMLPVTVLGGALFLVLADLAARTLARPLELPLSVVTAAIGGPFFLWLMTRAERAPGVV